MKSRIFPVGTIIALLLALGVSEHGVANDKHQRDSDRLLSFTYAFNRELRPTLEKKLLLTSADHGRMIKIPSFPEIGESAVSVDCSTPGIKNGVCRVTATRAKSSMENTMMENWGKKDAIQKVGEIGVIRKDAEIPKATAAAFRSCLRIMIPPPGDPLELHSLTITDNDRIEFWLEEPNSVPRKGERAERPRERTKALIHMGDLLARYCEAQQSERPAIAQQIEEEATRILPHSTRTK